MKIHPARPDRSIATASGGTVEVTGIAPDGDATATLRIWDDSDDSTGAVRLTRAECDDLIKVLQDTPAPGTR